MSDTVLKLEEAAYFLAQTIQCQDNHKLFIFNLNAFLSSARSVTYVMQTEHAHNPDFGIWYKNKQEEMKNDPDFAYFNELRITSVHQKVVKPPLQIRMDTPFTVKSGQSVSMPLNLFDEKGNIAKDVPMNVNGIEVRRMPITSAWRFDDRRDITVVDLCSSYFTKLTKIVEASTKFSQNKNSLQT